MRPLIRPGVVMLCGMGALHAAYPLVVDDAAIHPPGEMEIDATVDVRRDPATDTVTDNFTFTTGIYSWLEGSVGFGYGWQRERHPPSPEERNGILDLSLGVKVPLLDPAGGPFALTLSSTATFPTASRGLGVEATNLNFLFVATREWGCISLDGNAGFDWVPECGNDSSGEESGFFGIAVRWQATKRWMLFAETYALLTDHEDTDLRSILRCGCQAEITSGIFIGGAFEEGYAGTDETAISLGLTVVF